LSRPFPPETLAFLTVSPPPDRYGRAASVGVSTFRVPELRPGWVPSMSRGGRVLPGGVKHPPGACRVPAACPAPRSRFPPAGLSLTRRHRGFTVVHPSGLPLACCLRVERGHLGFSLELHTPPLPATHVRVGTGHRTLTRGYSVVDAIADPLSKRAHSTHATSCRTFTWRVLLSCDDLDPRQVPLLQVRSTLRVSDHPPDALSRESARLTQGCCHHAAIQRAVCLICSSSAHFLLR
jgi:hypothetical protein